MGIGLLALPAASIAAAIAFERDFASVQRTTGLVGVSLQNLRADLIGLSTEIPVAFSEITEIATLGGQLGVAAGDIQDFTRVVAQLTATTNLTSEAAGTALGRFQALLGVPGSEFENLASSILKVGVNSVATETQIVNIATQISSMGDFAGLTADQVIGLAGALASVGAQPEISRGTITRVFTLMSQAVANGTEDLEEFGRIAGITGSEFRDAFGTDQFGGVFQDFLAGIAVEGEKAVQTLRDLGITSVRDVPLLLRLANASDVVRQAFSDAATGYQAATELQSQYGIVAETTAAKLTTLGNSLVALLAEIGGSATGPIADLLDILNDVVNAFRDWLSTDANQRILLIGIAVTTVVGAFALLSSVLARAAAGMIAFRQGIVLGIGPMLGFRTAMDATTASTARFGTAAATSAASARLLVGAFRALTLVGLLTILPEISEGIGNVIDGIKGIDKELAPTLDRLEERFSAGNVFPGLQAATPELAAFNRGLAQTDVSLDGVWRDLARADEELAAFIATDPVEGARRLEELNRAFLEGGGNQETFNELMVDSIGELENVAVASSSTTAQLKLQAEEEDRLARATEEASIRLGVMAEDLTALGGAVVTGSAAFLDFGGVIQNVQEKTRAWAEKQAEATATSQDSWEDFYDGSSVSLRKFSEELEKQLQAQASFVGNLAIIAENGGVAFATQLAELGPEAAGLAAEAVNLSTEELQKFEANARTAGFLASAGFAEEFAANTDAIAAAAEQGGDEAVRAVVGAIQFGEQAVQQALDQYDVDFKVSADTAPATRQVDNWIRTNDGRSINVYTNVVRRGGGATFATGGHVRGPGSGTSDSIPAWLSNGEYVIRAAAVRKYGAGLFDSLNRGAAKFARGGQVGTRSSNAAVGMNGIMELGPRSLQRLTRQVVNVISIGNEQIARSASSGSRRLQNRGAG